MIKKRYLLLIVVVLMIVFGSVIGYTKPVLPFIQLPGEVWPGTEGLLPQFLFNNTGLTNTFAATLLVPTALLSALNARQRSPQTVSALFQVPLDTAIRRLGELGYLPHESGEPPVDPPPAH